MKWACSVNVDFRIASSFPEELNAAKFSSHFLSSFSGEDHAH
jgi:hypothetical protein